MPLKLITAPTVWPVNAAELADQHLRLTSSDGENEDLVPILAAAVDYFELECRRQLITATWEQQLDAFPAAPGDERVIRLPKPPLQSVTSVQYVDEAGATQTFSSSKYTVDTASEPGRIILKDNESWPATAVVAAAVKITFVAGYGATDAAVPYLLRQGIKMLAGHYYENREVMTSHLETNVLPLAVDSIADRYRVMEMVG